MSRIFSLPLKPYILKGTTKMNLTLKLSHEQVEMKLLRILSDYDQGLDDVSDLVESLEYLETYPGHNDLDTFIIYLFHLFGYGVERKGFEYEDLENYSLNMKKNILKQASDLDSFGIYLAMVKRLFIMKVININSYFNLGSNSDMKAMDYEWKRIKTRVEIILNMDEKVKDLPIDQKLVYAFENCGDDGPAYFWNYVTWHFLINEYFGESKIIDMFANYSDKVRDYLSNVIDSFKKFDWLDINRGNINNGFKRGWGYQSVMDDGDGYCFLPISFGHNRSFDVYEEGALEKIGSLTIICTEEGEWIVQPIDFNNDIVFLRNAYKDITDEVMSKLKEYIRQGMFKYSKPSLLLGKEEIETLNLDEVDFSKSCENIPVYHKTKSN